MFCTDEKENLLCLMKIPHNALFCYVTAALFFFKCNDFTLAAAENISQQWDLLCAGSAVQVVWGIIKVKRKNDVALSWMKTQLHNLAPSAFLHGGFRATPLI